MLDANTYPHILRSIVTATPPNGLLCLRTASKSLRNAVDARLSSHILVWENGRISSRLLPFQCLPRPLPELAEHVKILDIQAPHVEWGDEENRMCDLSISNSSRSISRPSSTPTCRCGWSALPHALPPLPNLQTVRRWGPHTCSAPPSPQTVTHYGPAIDAEGGPVPDKLVWYLLSPAAVSRFNRIDDGGVPRYVVAGARTGALFNIIDELGFKKEVEGVDELEADNDSNETNEAVSLAYHFAALLSMFWLDDEDEDATWALVDVESWPQFEGVEVKDAIRARVARCCAAANWDEGQMEGIDQKLRFLTMSQYQQEIGEVAALERDDHGWAFE
ncbi:uncharacterized protein CcaverHIS019_0307610 [Cutaneotrichosporon cavernicola]|uniref:F-box domain-containing protein n=1 Tax=Cutaneotrichosporon cavernicola TaxID=279322 RepID=A0AA48IFQ0_9TREE|nr:uncharacterized protein CcaverHIS019_0307610 [Cutaneotrichosporon cavernicola]BEI90691.1 hypothetical protein CcaverHIS019_0307610 [Cutaneotrichosporon cavernicola]BEI98469.1 hypothetical protein CcaverHIS631_0307680 [Cutaneotrichosporon cavernicola]